MGTSHYLKAQVDEIYIKHESPYTLWQVENLLCFHRFLLTFPHSLLILLLLLFCPNFQYHKPFIFCSVLKILAGYRYEARMATLGSYIWRLSHGGEVGRGRTVWEGLKDWKCGLVGDVPWEWAWRFQNLTGGPRCLPVAAWVLALSYYSSPVWATMSPPVSTGIRMD